MRIVEFGMGEGWAEGGRENGGEGRRVARGERERETARRGIATSLNLLSEAGCGRIRDEVLVGDLENYHGERMLGIQRRVPAAKGL